jgi:hypothetical protein
VSSMVRLHFLFLSSVTPTRNVDRGPGADSPAELLREPWGTLSAASVLPNFWIGVCIVSLAAFSDATELELGDELKCSEFFALENISLARLTPELLRFFSVVGVEFASPLPFRSVEADPLPEGITDAPSVGIEDVGGAVVVAGFELSPVVGPSAAVTSSSLPEPNMRFSKPPPPGWEEKLLRLFPARVKASRWRCVQVADIADRNNRGTRDCGRGVLRCYVTSMLRVTMLLASLCTRTSSG